MKNPGPIRIDSKDHAALANYAKVIASRFKMAEPAALGLLVKLDKKIREAIDTDIGMASLKIEVNTDL